MSDINSWSTTDASNNATPPDGFPENMAYSAVNNAARAVMGGTKRFFADIGGSLAAGGSADTYTLTLNSTYAAYFEGMLFTCSIPADCTGGAATINVNSIGAATITTRDGAAPPLGSLKTGGLYTFRYDGTNFQIEGSPPALLNMPGELAVTEVNETVAQLSAGSGSVNVDMTTGTYFYRTITGAITLSFTNPPASGRAAAFTLELTNGGTNVTWPASVEWEGGVEPTLTTAGTDILTFVSRDAGTTWRGFVAALDVS